MAPEELDPRMALANLLGQAANLFGQALIGLGPLVLPGIAMALAARLDHALEVALLSKMRPLSNSMKRRIFEDRGPLSDFASKIDVAYSLSIFDDKIHSDLGILRKIRNIFAHPEGQYKEMFNDPRVLEAVQQFEGYDKSINPVRLCAIKISECILAISKDESDLEMARQTLQRARRQPPDQQPPGKWSVVNKPN
jgi:hypothetical protein